MAYCNRPTVKTENEQEQVPIIPTIEKKEEKHMILVGKPAPAFTAPAYHKGQFTQVNLEDYKGKWVMLCFYPGDFTFV